MKNHISKLLFIVTAILICSSLLNAQRRSSASWSIPAGTPINVRINENLSSEDSRPGDRFTGVLTQPLIVNGRTAFPAGTDVGGQITSAKKSGRLSDPGVLELMLVSIGNTNVSSQPFVIKGVSHTKSNVTKIGGGAAAGAIIGGIVGGGKGAAVGAGVGAGAGTATAAATGKKPAKVESEAVLTFVSNGAPSGNSTGNFRDNRYSGHDDHAGRGRSHHDDDDDDDDRHERRPRGDGYSFGDRDREVLNGCLSGYDFESLPPGIQKKLARGGTLPPGQAKKLRALPDSCAVRLPRLPRGIERIIFGDRVILLEDGNRILDMFTYER